MKNYTKDADQCNITHDRLQAECFQWLWNMYPFTRPLCFAALNEIPKVPCETRKAHMIRVQRAKATGLVPGVYDLLFYWHGKLYGFDIKVGTDRLSDEQLAFAAAVEAHGGKCFAVRSFADFKFEIEKILNFQ